MESNHGVIAKVVSQALLLSVLAAIAHASDASQFDIHGIGLHMSMPEVEQKLKREFGASAQKSVSGDALEFDAETYAVFVRFAHGVYHGKTGKFSVLVNQRFYNARIDRNHRPATDDDLREFTQEVLAKYGLPDATARRPGELDDGWCDPHKQIDWGGGQRFCNPQFPSLTFSKQSFFPGEPTMQLILIDEGFESRMRRSTADQTEAR